MTDLVASGEGDDVVLVEVVLDVGARHCVPEQGHASDGGPAVLAHPPPAAAAVAVDGHGRRAVVGVVGRALVRVVPETVGAHHPARDACGTQCRSSSPCKGRV